MSWLKAVSFRLSSPVLQRAGLIKDAYGRPENNSLTLLNLQFERNARPVPELVSLSSLGW